MLGISSLHQSCLLYSTIFFTDDSTKSVDDLFEKIAQAELTKLSSELSDDEFEQVIPS